MLYTMLYIAKPCSIYNNIELLDLVNNSRKWNNIYDVTGCLAYIEGSDNTKTECQFIQVLEGSKSDLESIFAVAKLNERLGRVTLIKEGYIIKRKFNDWTMGIERIKLTDHPLFNVFFMMNEDVLSGDGNLDNNMLMEFMTLFCEQRITMKMQQNYISEL